MNLPTQQNACVFGGNGGLGSAIATYLSSQGCRTWSTSRQSSKDPYILQVDPAIRNGLSSLSSLSNLDIIVWSQGVNTNDTALNVNPETYQHVMNINVDFVVQTLHHLWEIGKINQGARLCIISSIWQEISRSNKFSYTVSKAAIAGLVKSAAIDFAPYGVLVNAVLPGVVDTTMTRAMLSDQQKNNVLRETPLNRLTQPEDIAFAVWSLVSPHNRAITGQSIIVDGGFSIMKSI
jgi:hypothetical protein